MLSLLIFLPVFALLLLLFLPEQKSHWAKYVTLIVSIAQVAMAVYLFQNFIPGNQIQFVEKHEWIRLGLGSLGIMSIQYYIGVDGLNITMVLLTSMIMLVGAISSWNIDHRPRAYHALFLLTSASITGCFVALDMFLFYIFFEFMLLPMYFLIGIWGGPKREYASIKFFLYTLVGSVLILLVLIGLYFSVIDPAATAATAGITEGIRETQLQLQYGKIAPEHMVHTFDMISMTHPDNYIVDSPLSIYSGWQMWGESLRGWAFLLLLIGFAIKLPTAPLHTWLPDAHVEAATPVSVVLAGVLLKVGGYGIIRTAYSFFPEEAADYAMWVGVLAVFSILYGAMNALAQKDLKKMIAYSSVSHMGFVLLGIASMTAEGINGSIYQMFSHGILSAMLFLIAGVIYDRTQDRMIDHYRGLSSKMPVFTVFVTIAFFASLGMPCFSGFIAEALVLLGAFHSPTANNLLPYWLVVLAALGLILGAVYFLWTMQRMFWGKFWINHNIVKLKTGMHDLSARELLMLIPLAVLTVLFGVYPALLLDKTGGWVINLVTSFLNWGS